MNELNNKVAVVTGGSAGLGRAIALGLADAGAHVIATSRSSSTVDEVANLVEAKGRQTARLSSDVTSRESLQTLHDRVLEMFGMVDILVNAAGITKRIPTLDCGEDLWASIMNVNLNGTLRACQIFGKTMLRRGAGRIINIASLSTFVAFDGVAAYCASKAAVAALTRSLAVEWGKGGVCVNAIAPGVFPTELNRHLLDTPRGQELLIRTPMHRFGKVDEIVTAAVYLASPGSSFTNGETLTVDGGYMASGVNQ